MTAIIWDDKYCIIDEKPKDDFYKTLEFHGHDVIDGEPDDFTEAWEDAFSYDDDHDSKEEDYKEIILANFTYKEVENKEEAYRWLIKESFNVS